MHGPLRYDHYRVLGIDRNASPQEIKRAYRNRVKLCHPDRNGTPQAGTLFCAVHEAYETLREPERRRLYDDRLAGYRSAPQPTTQWYTQGSRQHPTVPDYRVSRFAFIGLHITGLCFGLSVVMGILVGITFLGWPVYVLVFTLPGLVVIPESIAGLRS